MGWLKMLLNINNAQGIREAMLMSYKKHLRGARKGMIPDADTPPHHVGLYGALASRYKSRRVPMMEALIWAELVPFMLMSETDAVEALAEYVVYKERPPEAQKAWLKKVINDALRTAPTSEESLRSMAPVAMINQVAWCNLLNPDIKRTIEEEARKMSSAFNEEANL